MPNCSSSHSASCCNDSGLLVEVEEEYQFEQIFLLTSLFIKSPYRKWPAGTGLGLRRMLVVGALVDRYKGPKICTNLVANRPPTGRNDCRRCAELAVYQPTRKGIKTLEPFREGYCSLIRLVWVAIHRQPLFWKTQVSVNRPQ